MRLDRVGALVAAVTLIASSLAADRPAPIVDATGTDRRVEMTARQGLAAEQATSAVPETLRLVDYKRRPLCEPDRDVAGVCFPGDQAELSIRACGGERAILPLWRRARPTVASPWSQWVYVLGWTCPRDYLDVPELTAEDFRQLPLAPSPVRVQPDQLEHLVNMPTIVYTDPTPQFFTTDLLGHTFEVEATPATYTWDFGDGAVLTTTSPGHPFPWEDVTHAYPTRGSWTITLTTEFTGRYRLAGDQAWTPVNGTATTTTTVGPITTREARARLVGADCNERPHDCA